MYNSNIPSDRELPSTGKLIKSTVIAAATAGVLLVGVVMPAEYGIDPTGIGNALGLKRMGEIKVSLAEEAAAEKTKEEIAGGCAVDLTPQKVAEKQPINTQRSDEMSVTLAPDEGTEIKVTMVKGAKVDYIWETNGDKANFDVHGDSKKLNINYQSYYKGSEKKREGTLEAAFDGHHGWFWRNRTKEPLTITINMNGEYSDIKRY